MKNVKCVQVSNGINTDYIFNSRVSIRKSVIQKDFFKYSEEISKSFDRLYFSECGYLYFNDYTILLMYELNPYKDFEGKINWIYNNTTGIVRDITIGKTITEYQLRIFNEESFPSVYVLPVK